MGIRLLEDVLAHAPDDLTPAELVVLVVLAVNARDNTREAWPGMDVLARRARLTPIGVRRALQRLAARGYDVRVPLGKDKRGRLFYSGSGRRTTYRLPNFLVSGGTGVPPEGGTTVPPDDATWRYESDNLAVPQVPAGGTAVPPFSSGTVKEPSAARARAIPGATDEELAEIKTALLRDRGEISGQLLTHILRVDGPDLLAELRQRVQRQDAAEADKARQTEPACDHGIPGGAVPHPTSGQPWCPLCRRESA